LSREELVSGLKRIFLLWEDLFRVVLVLLAAFVLFVNFVVEGGDRLPTNDLSPAFIPQYQNPSELQLGEVTAIIDGQTIDVSIGGQSLRVRYYGVSLAPESSRCAGQAGLRNRQLLVGTLLRLLAPSTGASGEAEVFRYVFNEQGLSIEGQLVSEGFLRVQRNGGEYEEQLLSLERRAARARPPRRGGGVDV
jgi:endonuclease YncB( thermonuclease family)